MPLNRMHGLPVLSAFALMLVFAATAWAQEGREVQPGDTPQVVVVSEKSPFAAGALEWLLPTAGYAYAGDWGRAIPTALVRLVGFGIYAADQFTIFGDPPPCEGACMVGATMAVIGTVWAVIDAGATAKRENEKRRAEALAVAVIPALGHAGVGIGVRLRTKW